jgi:tRNA G18 (ribose-2'-O)-methylase SpoU
MTHWPGRVAVEPVDDPADDRVADYAGLSDPEARRRLERPGGGSGSVGIFIAEGSLVIGHLVRSPYRVRSFLVTERGLAALEPLLATDGAALEAPVYLATQPMMEAIAGFRFHRGSLAAADRLPLADPIALAAGAHRLLLVEGVGDNENLGALFRNAAAFGIDAVLLDPTTADPLYRRSVRVSAGHVLRMPFARVSREDWPVGAIAALQAQGFEVVALTPSGSADDLRTLPAGAPQPRRALLVGTEGDGLSAAALAAADRRVRIAMAPDVDSLNVATAAAIALHHLAAGHLGSMGR